MHEILSDKKVIFFDVGYTIDYPVSGDWIFTSKFYEIAGERLKKCPYGSVRSARRAATEYLAKNHLVRNEEEETDRFRHYFRIVSDMLELRMTEDEIMAVSLDRAYNMENYAIYPDAERVIRTLGRTYRLGIISDTWPSIGHQLRSLGVLKYFPFATYSFELGVFKPDPRMYEDALRKCGCAASETVFIDDGPQNLEGAAKLGITPVLIAANPASDVETPYLKSHSLSELL